MRDKYKYIFIPVLILVYNLLAVNLLFAEEIQSDNAKELQSVNQKRIIPYVPLPTPKDYTINEIKIILMKSPGWLAYEAFRTGDTSICDSIKNASDCWDAVNVLVFIKVLSKGKCDNLPFRFKDYTDVCKTLSQNNCSMLSGYKKSFCEALLINNVNTMRKSFLDPEFSEYIPDKKTFAEYFINIYNGFKKNNEYACDKFTTKNLLKRASCNMLFGNQEFEKKIDGISQDIIYVLDSKKSGNTKSCIKIENSSIKDACYDNSVKNLDDILKVIWD